MIAESQDGHRRIVCGGLSSAIGVARLNPDRASVLSGSARVGDPSIPFKLESLNSGLPQQVRAVAVKAPYERLVISRVAQLEADAFDLHDLGACGLAVPSQRPEYAAVGDRAGHGRRAV
jgi:hypothetical protein